MKKREKKGQIYLIATIIIVGLVISLVVVLNYSNRANFSNAEEVAKELSIEGEKVLDYGLVTSDDRFEDFSRDYSAYVGEGKDIYYILVDGGVREAYKYSEGVKVDLSGNLNVGNDIEFVLDGKIYTFKLEEGVNFHFIIVHDVGGERYVYTG